MNFRRGQIVKLTADGRTVDAMVMIVSPNGRSLMLGFDHMLMGYVNFMPVLRDDDGTYRDLIGNDPLKIEVLQ